MKNIYILCEGQTEERFVNDVLCERFLTKEIYLYPVIIATKRTVNQKYKGGISSYGKIKKELQILCREHPRELVTTMIDYYRLPEDTPGMDEQGHDLYSHIQIVETAIQKDVGSENLICYLSVHEYEALLFSDVSKFRLIGEEIDIGRLMDIRTQFTSPEHINSSIETAPSKRILTIFPDYLKIINGVTLAQEIGISRMRDECVHFNQWVERLYI